MEFKKAFDLLADSVGEYLCYQIDCGADAVQIFDSWVGILPNSQYTELLAPTMQKLIARVKAKGKPVILYSQPTRHLLNTLQSLEPTALSVDWRSDLYEVTQQLRENTRKI